MSDFYSSIADSYERIFPASPGTIDFFQNLPMKKASNILDVACATGAYSRPLHQMGHVVTGIDLDPAMIELARTLDPEGDYRLHSMTEIPLLKKNFDFIFCIGNSLVHLPNQRSMTQMIRDCYDVLHPSGHLLIQILNYDRVLDQKIEELPLLQHRESGTYFYRYYHHQKDALDFHTLLETPSKRIENHQRLFPLRSGALIGFFQASGFQSIRHYGNFLAEPFSLADSFSLIVLGQKGMEAS